IKIVMMGFTALRRDVIDDFELYSAKLSISWTFAPTRNACEPLAGFLNTQKSQASPVTLKA
ncbi:MAG: hypothetical protein WBA55_09180, partial [Allopontixanthobacter sediminis]